ncbi:MAG TPA: O-methyltransferase [Saprospiraceae bacterium]|nr:O-methyltransferase [Saprospiraceae bacterium]
MNSFEKDELIRYSTSQSTDAPDYLKDLERKTHLHTLAPQMISGQLQGRLLSLISKLKSPQRILEIGTFTGYSALCLAEGLASDGILDTIEIDSTYDHFIDDIKQNIPLSKQILFHKGNALDIIPTLPYQWDLVFIDGAKKDYLNYLKIVEKEMISGSILISDNILWYGKVLNSVKDRETQVLHDYNTYLASSPDWMNLILPIRDGISISIKK